VLFNSRWLPLLAGLLLSAQASAALAQKPSPSGAASKAGPVTVQQILDGKQLYIEGKQAVVKQQAKVPEAIKTLQSRGQLGFSSGAVARINRFSSMKLGSSCFLLEQGQILVSGPQNGCTRSSRLSVRGTNYVMQVDAAGQSQIAVLEGVVELQALRDGAPIASMLPILVKAGQQAQLDPQGVMAALSQLKRSDYERYMSGPLFAGFQRALPYLPALIEYVLRTYPGLRIPPALLQQAAALNALPKPKAPLQPPLQQQPQPQARPQPQQQQEPPQTPTLAF